MELLSETLTETSYRTWFLPIRPKSIDEELKIIYLDIPEEFVLGVIEQRYQQTLHDKAEQVIGEPYRVVVQLMEEDGTDETDLSAEDVSLPTFPQEPVEKVDNFSETVKKNVKKAEISTDLEKPQKKQMLNNGRDNQNNLLKDEVYFNPRYNFDNFVVGNNNKYAYSAAFAVAKSPSIAYNPLFIYGGSGLGKTHLMHAIGHYIMEHYPEKKVLYVSSEMFTNELVSALEKKNMRAFKNKYRNVDVLLIDDIQFIEGKESTQEEFFHTFNTLHDMNKQIIISSDRAPNKLIKLDDRLTSRFQWNMTADIQPPDYETRVAILRKKAKLDNLELTEGVLDVINLIAEKIKFNIRELEGAYTRITAFSQTMEKEITVKFAREILKDILPAADFKISCESIKKIVCKHFNIKIADIESSKRTRNLAHPRQIAMYLCRELTDTSLPKIGEAFGGRDHTTALHACEKISEEIKTNPATAELVQQLRDEINGN